MVTYRDLPELVMNNILACASKGAGSNVTMWKRALPLLSVCHNWRVYGKHHLYRYVIVEHVDPRFSMYDSDEECDCIDKDTATYLESLGCGSMDSSVAEALKNGTPVRIHTNIKLIDELGMENMVEQLLFSDKRPHGIIIEWLVSLKAFVFVMRALFRGLPEEIKLIKPFVKLYELELMDTEPIDHAESQCYAASHEAAHVLINKYSNISSISTTALDPHEFFQKLIAELAVGYDKQLTKFASSMPATFPYTLLAPNLVELDLRFWASLDIIFPTISPRSLRKISIALDKHPFSWDMFHVGNVSEAIVFDNLVDLSISGMARDLDDGNAVIAHGLDLVFPKLERLSLSNISITRKDAQAMMAHGLRRLRCKGSIITASQLCKHPLGNLDNLYLSWVEEPYPEEADDFILLANEIFNKTEGIGHVQLEIRYANFAGSMDGVDWPYLTHLSLSFTMPFKALFDILPNVPNLVQLDMIIGSYDEHVLDETTELLINIKKHYSTPSSSKIKTLRLADERAVSRQESFFQPQFRKALENLKWYWPQLKDIVTLG